MIEMVSSFREGTKHKSQVHCFTNAETTLTVYFTNARPKVSFNECLGFLLYW